MADLSDWGVYRIPRDTWMAVPRGVETTAARLMGIEVKIIEEIEGDVVFVIDMRAMREALDRATFPPVPNYATDTLAWKVRFGVG